MPRPVVGLNELYCYGMRSCTLYPILTEYGSYFCVFRVDKLAIQYCMEYIYGSPHLEGLSLSNLTCLPQFHTAN